MNFQRPNIARMHGYTPGEQLADAEVIKLNTNENPYPPSPAVARALQELPVAQLRRYPPPLADAFRRVCADLHGLEPANVIPTNGGDELLRLVLTTFVNPGETVAVVRPSYSLYPVLTAIQDCRLFEIDLNPDWSMPDNFGARLAESNARLCILVNPHAPSGALLSTDYLASLAEAFSGLLLVDEAYVDFVDPELGYDATPLVRQFDNFLILRTLSKGYSLAGLRFGYGLGPAELIAPMLLKTRDSYNTDLVAQRLATAALGDQAYARDTWARVRAARTTLARDLLALGLESLPSQSNFLLCQVPEKPGAQALQQALKARKILVRHFDQDRLRDKLRITVGNDEENAALLQAIAAILAG
ncbi:MAG: histidinol-phosphate transaminase [Pseudohongiellaceae bacterium]